VSQLVVPDLFRGCPRTENSPEDYEQWRARHLPEVVVGDVGLAVDELRRMGLSVGLLGFCYGGGVLMNELARGSDGINPAAAAVFYPTRFDAEAAGRLAECPLMAVFGDKDKQVSPEVVEDLKRGLGMNTVMEDCDLLIYEGAGHGFAHHPKSPQDMDDAEILRYQTSEWFNKHLPGGHHDVQSDADS
jgi:carboxymethylenebutenolidase